MQVKENHITLTWTLTALPAQTEARQGECVTLRLRADADGVCLEVYYDFHEKPLMLHAPEPMQAGDRITLRLMPHRIELYLNDRLEDEEWPAGERLYDVSDAFEPPLTCEIVTDVPPVAEELPTVLGSFENAQGWKPSARVFVGDCMPYVHGDRYHVLYLKDRRHHKSKWGLGAHQWEHLSTEDFATWQIHPMAVAITAPHEGSICTGSHIACGGREYLFYTVRMSDRSPARICRSVSEDGYHFVKDERFCFTLSEKYHAVSARDPKVICDENGLYHMFLTTSLNASNRGCLAHLISRDLNVWQEEADPIYISEDATQPECPDYISFAGRTYLIYSLHGKAHYLISDHPFGPWRVPKEPIIPCHSVPKGGVWGDKIVFTGFRPEGGYAGTMTFLSAVADAEGELHFL